MLPLLINAILVATSVAEAQGRQTLARRRMRPADAPAWGGVVVVSTFPLHLLCRASFVCPTTGMEIPHRLGEWARIARYRHIDTLGRTYRYARGHPLSAVLAFGLEAVPSEVTVVIDGATTARAVCPRVDCVMRYRTALQYVSDDDRAQAATEFELLLDSIAG